MSVMSPIPMPVNDEPVKPAAIHPLAFEVRYVERQVKDPANPSIPKTAVVPVEWVRWAKKGVERPTTGGDAIARIRKSVPEWLAIQPYYDAWKAGNNLEVINGLPLAVWAGITPDIAELLKPFRVYSVEDLATMNDSVMQRIPHPDISRIRDRAKKFLDTKEIAEAVREINDLDQALKERDEQIATLQKQMNALMAANAITSQAATGGKTKKKNAEAAA